ncbi:MAG: hypothetical protein NTX52_11060, partial [Planctomycetota bacterium]|nr:hypothetical protein [Planctomycetota bacterium]
VRALNKIAKELEHTNQLLILIELLGILVFGCTNPNITQDNQLKISAYIPTVVKAENCSSNGVISEDDLGNRAYYILCSFEDKSIKTYWIDAGNPVWLYEGSDAYKQPFQQWDISNFTGNLTGVK